MNVYQSKITAHGPYRHEKSANNRADKISGGETFVFTSETSDGDKALSEFRDARVRRL